ncbi:cytochrome P450 2C20-like [Hemicordylus capensis]|uniref:cytochrome P450 2C20-like n=1 Tax=Hemicordylus capensis TaxID=884348 RepID=UPI002303F9A3|nr:cytochrome P450 2C20-like [Hemicordylus capensis]
MGLLGAVPLLLLSCITFFLALLWRSHRSRSKLPPGPTPLPFVGNLLLQVDIRDLIGSFHRLHQQYGPVFTIHMGSRPVVVLCGYEAVKEALVDHAEAFGGRGLTTGLENDLNNFGIITTNGERWRQMRRFSLSTLRNFGMGKRSIEERIQEEAQFLVEALKKTEGRPFDPTFHLGHAVSNVICSVVFGTRFDYEDKDFTTLLNLISQIIQLVLSTKAQLAVCFPELMRIVPGSHHRQSEYEEELVRFVSKRIQMHRESLDPNCPQDFIDSFLTKMEQEKNNPASEFHDKNLMASVLHLFIAGAETVSTTLRYGLLFLLRYPEIEAKVQEEIDRVIGRNRDPCMEDRSRMPYTDAVIHEILRFVDINPLGTPHSVTSDTHFRGYTIPKGTTVFTFLTTVLRDPQHFETPMKFNPGHFLDEDGAFKKSEAFLAFSAGKRVCPGESLARMELFLFLIMLLQNFHLKKLHDGEEVNILPQKQSAGNHPRPYRICMVPRNKA